MSRPRGQSALRFLVCAGALALSVASVAAYTPIRLEVEGQVYIVGWDPYSNVAVVVNTDTPNGVTAGSRPFLAVRNIFERRSSHSPLRFFLSQSSTPQNLGLDGVNLVTFKDTPENRSATAGYAAVGYVWGTLTGGRFLVTEADIAFSPLSAHTTTGAGGIDIESLGGHEAGHFNSFLHSGVMSAIEYPSWFGADAFERELAEDDLAAAAFLYPFDDGASRTGSLRGVVSKPGGAGVFGAQVVALRKGDGYPVSEVSLAGGSWTIGGLPPGDYTVYVEAFDGPYEMPGHFAGGIYSATPFDTAIQTTFAGGNSSPATFTVQAGVTTDIGPIEVPATAGPLNPRSLGAHPSGVVYGQTGLNLVQGQVTYLTVLGPGMNLVPDDGVSVSGTGVTLLTSSVRRGFSGGYPYLTLPLAVHPAAPAGSRTVFATDGTYLAAITGGIEVHATVPRPDLLRNDEVSTPTPLPPIASILPMTAAGPDAFPGIGEGALREANGSDDDDDLYASRIPSGFLDPDESVLTDGGRNLVFYQLTDPNRTMFLDKTPSGRIRVSYTSSAVRCASDAACNDGNACTSNHCDSATRSCIYPPLAAGVACGSAAGSACSAPDTCDGAGTCIPNHVAGPVACDDGNACSPASACRLGGCAPLQSGRVVAAGTGHSCALRANGTLACWGDDTDYQVSDPGSSIESHYEVVAGASHTCALRDDSRIRCWGNDGAGQVSGPNASFETFVQVAAGAYHTCGVRTTGSIRCWGYNVQQQSSGPMTEPGPFLEVQAGTNHTCAVRADGRLRCWGDDSFLQTSGPNASTHTYTSVSLGAAHTCAVRSNGRLDCWGWDEYGQVSQPAANTASYLAVDLGSTHTCAVRADHRLACWGAEDGSGTISGPNQSSASYYEVCAGFAHTCALRLDGSVECWGQDEAGQTSGALFATGNHGIRLCDDGDPATADACDPGSGCSHVSSLRD